MMGAFVLTMVKAFLLFGGVVACGWALLEALLVWWSKRPGNLTHYVHQRVASMLAPEHWAQVVAQVAAGAPGFRLDAWSGSVTLHACGFSIRWSRGNGAIVTLRNPDDFWESRETPLTWKLSQQLKRAMCAAWPDKAPPRVIKAEKKPRRSDGSFIELAEAERKRLGC